MKTCTHGRTVISAMMMLAVASAITVRAELPANVSLPDRRAELEWAKRITSENDLVALGTISFDYTTLPKDFYKRRPSKVIAKFHVRRVYKGAQVGDTVSIRLLSDMLAVPGENITAGAKRDQVWADINRRVAESDKRLAVLDESFRGARISQTAYEIERQKMMDERSATLRESAQLSTVEGVRTGSVEGASFFERGGIIKSANEYLLIVDKAVDSNVTEAQPIYELSYVRTGAFWGQQRNHVVGLLEEIDSGR
jgi:hypothetical protein